MELAHRATSFSLDRSNPGTSLTMPQITTQVSTDRTSLSSPMDRSSNHSDDHPSQPPKAGFSFPALHLGSFSSLKMDDFSQFASSEPSTSNPARSDTPQQLSPGGKRSPSLFEVARMGRSGSPFRPVSSLGLNAGGMRPGSSLRERSKSPSRMKGNDSMLLAQDENEPDENGPDEVDLGKEDYLIHSPGFLSEVGSQTFLRQSRINRRKTIVQDASPFVNLPALTEGREGAQSRKASAVLDGLELGPQIGQEGQEAQIAQGSHVQAIPMPTRAEDTARPQLGVGIPQHSSSGSVEVRKRRLPSTPGRSASGLNVSSHMNDDDVPGSRRLDETGVHNGPVYSGLNESPSRNIGVQNRSISASQIPQTSQQDQSQSRRKSAIDPSFVNTTRSYPPMPLEANLDSMPSFPVYPGLGIGKDEGPYPSSARPRKSTDREDIPVRRSVDARAGQGRMRSGQDGPPLRIKVPPVQEEICLECLMRDRDLMHVDVTGEGVWERSSDVDWRERLETEDACVKEFRQDPENRRRREDSEGEARALLESSLLREEDERVRSRVGWKGFYWEEGAEGSGLPRHFRGHVEGELLEERLKELAVKMGAPAAHRFKTLQIYLRDQALSVGLVHPLARRAEIDAAMSRSTIYSSHGIGQRIDPNVLGANQPVPHIRSHRSQDVLRDITDVQQPYPVRRITQPGHQLDPAQRSTMYAKPLEEPAQGSAYTRSKTIPAIALGGAAPPRRDPVQHSRSQPLHLDVRKGRGISSPGLLENMSSDPVDYEESLNYGNGRVEAGDQGSISDSPIRPFSFAVWAGHGGPQSARSSPGPGRERRNSSVLGRWGGSVTSFFGGSQGGASGSMMDMHLGLDQDRHRGLTSSTPVPQPRSVSMASPPRPKFFSQTSSSFQSHSQMPQPSQTPISVSDSGSFVDEPVQRAPERIEEKKKKKGFKGFLQKLGAGSKKRASNGASRTSYDRSSRGDDDISSPLPPPPSLSMLVERSDRRSKHSRTPSSGSMGSTAPPAQIPSNERPSLSSDQPWQQRSVSAPVVKSPSKTSLPSTSPTSSRFPYAREYSSPSAAQDYQRNSFASTSTSRRRSSVPGLYNGLGEDNEGRRMESTLEVLENDNGLNHREPGWGDNGVPHSRFVQDRSVPGSLSNSIGTALTPSLDTPLMGNINSCSYGSSSLIDKQKTLPPLPPHQSAFAIHNSPSPGERSPDSFNAFFGDRVTMAQRFSYGSHGRTASSGQRSVSYERTDQDIEPSRARKTKSKFGLKTLFSNGNKTNDPTPERQSHGREPSINDRNDPYAEDLSRIKSAGPQWMGQQPAYEQSASSTPSQGRPQRQVYDERARRTYYQ